MSTYYCNGNPNFLRCVKPEVLNDLQSCITYFVQNTTDCSEKYLNNNEGLSDKEQMNIAIEYGQCSLMEILRAENIQEAEFNECFNKNYDETIRSPILKKQYGLLLCHMNHLTSTSKTAPLRCAGRR